MSPESFAILIAVAEPVLRQSIRKSLLATGFVLDEAAGPRAALAITKHAHFDLVLVDFDPAICSSLRAQSPLLGIIALRTSGTEEDDDWRALDAGADDCVAVPFRYREIVARMTAVLHRPRTAKPKLRDHFRVGDIELDLRLQTVRSNGQNVHLSPHEFELLTVLMSNVGVALTHTRLARAAWGRDTQHNREYVRTYIQSLRQKLERNPAQPKYILTHPWVGYRFTDPVLHKHN